MDIFSDKGEIEPEITVHEVRRYEPGFYETLMRLWYVDAAGVIYLLHAPDAAITLQRFDEDLPAAATPVSRSGVNEAARELAALVDRHIRPRRSA